MKTLITLVTSLLLSLGFAQSDKDMTSKAMLVLLPDAGLNVRSLSVPSEQHISNTMESTQETFLPLAFLVWDHDGKPFNDLTIAKEGKAFIQADREVGRIFAIMRGDKEVGEVFLEAPDGAIGQTVFTEAASREIESSILSEPPAYLQAYFRSGSEPGLYKIRFTLLDGNSTQVLLSEN